MDGANEMELTESAWVWVACFGGAGGALSAWLAARGSQLVPTGLRQRAPMVVLWRLGHLLVAAAVAAGTSAATAWMVGSIAPPAPWVETRAFSAALAFFWIGFVTAGWLAAERDKRVLRRAVCSAATAPAAHPDLVEALAHASPDAVYEAVQALMPRRVVR